MIQMTSQITIQVVAVTRENVIDKVESYEGHTLDTDTYYKEPEKPVMVNGVFILR